MNKRKKKKGRKVARPHLGRRKFIYAAAAVTTLAGLGAFFVSSRGIAPRLHNPTYIGKHKNRYIIMDTYHHRILYSEDINAHIKHWRTLDDEIAGTHSFAAADDLIVADDTEQNAIRVYRADESKITLVQKIGNLPTRPHRVRYSRAHKAFYVLTSDNQRLYKFMREAEGLKLISSRRLPFLRDVYTRSMTIINELMFFTSGPGHITGVRYLDDSFEPVIQIPIPSVIAVPGHMIDIFVSGDGWHYITGARPYYKIGHVFRARSLSAMKRGEYEEVTSALLGERIYYYMNEFDGRFWLPYYGGESKQEGIVSFRHGIDGAIEDVRTIHAAGAPGVDEINRKKMFPL